MRVNELPARTRAGALLRQRLDLGDKAVAAVALQSPDCHHQHDDLPVAATW